MFSNLILYRLAIRPDTNLNVEEALQAGAFTPCGATQEKSSGWVPPRGDEFGALCEPIAGHWILKLQTETKAVPADAIDRKFKERVTQIEAQTGRKPGKKESREIKDDIKLELLPLAFAKRSSSLVWIDRDARLLVIDAASQAKADEVVTLLVRSINGLAVSLVSTKVSPTSLMSDWLVTEEVSPGFTVDRECELKAADESKAVVRYAKHALDIEEVKAHVMAGKLPTKLALTYDSRVSFVLTEGLALKKLAFLDVALEGGSNDARDGFDADVTIATGELQRLIPALLDALGGELVAEAQP